MTSTLPNSVDIFQFHQGLKQNLQSYNNQQGKGSQYENCEDSNKGSGSKGGKGYRNETSK